MNFPTSTTLQKLEIPTTALEKNKIKINPLNGLRQRLIGVAQAADILEQAGPKI
jgi:hypothetical protein